jgi:predicted AAA+ superfamily ATPase
MVQRLLQDRIVSLLKFFPATAIVGPRQSGKTTLAKMIQDRLDRKSLYLDLENPLDQSRLLDPLSFFRANAEKCLIIDEIQRNPELFPLLRSVIDEDRKPCRFILLGSASPELLFMSSETLTGRVVYLELTPFLFPEIKHIMKMGEHWLTGGFPQPFLTDDQHFRSEWFKSFFTTYIERDFRLLGLHANTQNLSRLFMMLAHQSGSILNKASLSKSLELNHASVSNYIRYFERAFLVRMLQPWYQNIRKRLVKSPKVYIRDTGLLHYLLGIKDGETIVGHPAAGHSWEGYIIEQVTGCLGDDFGYYFYRTQDGAECDLVITKDMKPVSSIEVKFTSSPRSSRGFTTAISDLKTQFNCIIIPECNQPFTLPGNTVVTDLEGYLDLFKRQG